MTYEEENIKIRERQNEIDQEIALLKVLYSSIPYNDFLREAKQASIENRLSRLNHEHERLTDRLKASPQKRARMDRQENVSDVIGWIFEHPLLSFFIFDVVALLILYAAGAFRS